MSTRLAVPPRQISESCYCLGLRRAARTLSRRYDEALRPLELNNGQFSMLAAIAGLAPVSLNVLADTLAMDRTTVTAALKPLQRRGLVVVEVSASDLRAREADLTVDGRALLARAVKRWQGVQQVIEAELTPDGSHRLHEQLRRLT
ncbi:MAG: MarR family winged helix-turn-helix transcriptional regulator [Burkholderiaceae bacterium]